MESSSALGTLHPLYSRLLWSSSIIIINCSLKIRPAFSSCQVLGSLERCSQVPQPTCFWEVQRQAETLSRFPNLYFGTIQLGNLTMRIERCCLGAHSSAKSKADFHKHHHYNSEPDSSPSSQLSCSPQCPEKNDEQWDCREPVRENREVGTAS